MARTKSVKSKTKSRAPQKKAAPVKKIVIPTDKTLGKWTTAELNAYITEYKLRVPKDGKGTGASGKVVNKDLREVVSNHRGNSPRKSPKSSPKKKPTKAKPSTGKTTLKTTLKKTEEKVVSKWTRKECEDYIEENDLESEVPENGDGSGVKGKVVNKDLQGVVREHKKSLESQTKATISKKTTKSQKKVAKKVVPKKTSAKKTSAKTSTKSSSKSTKVEKDLLDAFKGLSELPDSLKKLIDEYLATQIPILIKKYSKEEDSEGEAGDSTEEESGDEVSGDEVSGDEVSGDEVSGEGSGDEVSEDDE